MADYTENVINTGSTLFDYLKSHLNIETDYTDDDTLLQYYLDVSQNLIFQELNDFTLTGSTISTSIFHAIILLASHFYLNRNMVSFSQGLEIPYTFKYLLSPYKNHVIV